LSAPRPETELLGHYLEAVLPDQIDAYVWFVQTTAVTPLAGGRPRSAPGTPVPSAYDRRLGLTAVVGAGPNPLYVININRWR